MEYRHVIYPPEDALHLDCSPDVKQIVWTDDTVHQILSEVPIQKIFFDADKDQRVLGGHDISELLFTAG